jgi:hypothetical protein
VAKPVDGFLPGGIHRAEFAGTNLAADVYAHRLEYAGMSEVKRMILVWGQLTESYFGGTSISNPLTGWYPRSTTFSPLKIPHDHNGVNRFVM